MFVCVLGVTECERQGLQCSERGDFLSAQPDFLSDRWRCVDSEGEELEWTYSDKPLTEDECSGEDRVANHRAAVDLFWICLLSDCEALCVCVCTHVVVLSRFQAVPGSDLLVGAEDAEVLQTMTSDLTTCVQGYTHTQYYHLILFFLLCTVMATTFTHILYSSKTQQYLYVLLSVMIIVLYHIKPRIGSIRDSIHAVSLLLQYKSKDLSSFYTGDVLVSLSMCSGAVLPPCGAVQQTDSV